MHRCLPLFLFLSGCQFVTPEAAALRNFNPLEVAPDQITAGISLPDGVALAEAGAVLVLQAERRDTGASTSGHFVLAQENAAGLTGLALNPLDFERFTDLQSEIRAWREVAPRATSGSITVTTALCREGSGPAEDAELSVWLEAGPDYPLRPVLDGVPLSEIDDLLDRDDAACG